LNIQEYISSGILEAYALGEVTASERAEVEQAILHYPELKEELRKVEETIEALAQKASVMPAPGLKQRIMSAASANKREATILSMRQPSQTRVWKLAAAASIAVAIGMSYMAFDYRSRWIEREIAFNELNSRNRQIAEDYNVVNQKLDKIQGDLTIIESTAFKKVVMKGTANDLQALASVYWNESTQEVYVSVQRLKEISHEKQFQLWANVKGKMVDVGVFDAGFTGLLKMKNVSGAAAFAVTIEPRGGNENPTLSTMQVIGPLSREKS
jgi:anti-sigma-K factor RskA